MSGSPVVGTSLADDEVLLLFRALLRFASLRDPACAPSRERPEGGCPLLARCSRWQQPSRQREQRGQKGQKGRRQRFDEELEAEQDWPCRKLLDALDAEVNWIGRRA